ncbi:MAG: hypothetical protein M3Y64_06550, partial [Gemmatimonadota bacterium]|nr:hypothetical protein [Gemmatimonadota bacterium]
MTDQLPQPDSENEPTDEWNAIARFLAGESSAAEATELRQWLASHPGQADTVAALDAMLPVVAVDIFSVDSALADSDVHLSPAHIEAALRNVRARIGPVLLKTSAAALPLSRAATSDA